MRLKRIALKEIDFKDTRFCVTQAYSYDFLLAPLKEMGLISPPLVTVRGGNLVSITGWKRLQACRRLKFPSIPVLLCAEKDDLRAFRIALFDNLTARPIPPIELSEIMMRLKNFGLDETKIIQSYLPLFSVPPTFAYYALFLKIARLQIREKRFAVERRLALPVLEQLTRFAPKDRKPLLLFLAHLSQNKQKELLEMIKEISLRDGCSIPDILTDKALREISESPALSAVQKAEGIRNIIKEKRFPCLSDKNRTFQLARKKLAWPQDVTLVPTPFYEDRTLHLKFSFTGQADYKKKLSRLRALAEKDDFMSLFAANTDE